MPNIQRSQEAEEFLDARQHTAPDIVSACEGWTAHEVTAHLTAAAAEITRHLEPYLQGEPVPTTRTFEKREPPYRAMDDARLCRRLAAEEQRMRSVIEQVLAQDPDAVIPWTGRQMSVAKFLPHLRNEFAIHRWDVVGDDEISTELLSQPELTEHAVSVLGRILLRRGAAYDPAAGEDLHVRLRAGQSPDVRLVVEAGQAGLEMATRDDVEPYVELDPAARTLIIWGRRPDQRGRFRSNIDPPILRRLQALLADIDSAVDSGGGLIWPHSAGARPADPRCNDGARRSHSPSGARKGSSAVARPDRSFGGPMDIGLGLPITDPPALLHWARRADAGPFRTLGLLDRLVYDNPEPLVTLAAVAGATTRIRVQTEVLITPLRDPVLLASQCATLDRISGGRLTLGIGLGGRDDDYRAAGVDPRGRGRRLDAQLEVLRRIWSGVPYTDADGEVGTVGPPPHRPGGPEIPFGAFAPAAIKRIGRFGDGFIGAAAVPVLDTMFRSVEQVWAEAGRPGRPRLMAQVNAALGPPAVVEQARSALSAYYGFGPPVDHKSRRCSTRRARSATRSTPWPDSAPTRWCSTAGATTSTRSSGSPTRWPDPAAGASSSMISSRRPSVSRGEVS